MRFLRLGKDRYPIVNPYKRIKGRVVFPACYSWWRGAPISRLMFIRPWQRRPLTSESGGTER